jgi:hypothetical protein
MVTYILIREHCIKPLGMARVSGSMKGLYKTLPYLGTSTIVLMPVSGVMMVGTGFSLN